MDIPGRRKKDGPSKTILELYLYLLLERFDSFLCEEITQRFRLSERTVFRYVKELNAVCPDAEIRCSGREGRKEFVVKKWLEAPKLVSFPEDLHLSRLSRLICLYYLVNDKAQEFFYPDEYDEPLSASDLTDIIIKAGLPEFSLRTLQRDLKEICEALDLFDEYEAAH